ncbi:MAG: tetratricopeptide repeat protein, partial [Candidatus Krumholzibacteriia bacterium]
MEYAQAVAVYCCACAFQRDIEELDRLRAIMGEDTIRENVNIHIAYLWSYIYIGQWDVLFADSESYIRAHEHQVDHYLPYFYFFRSWAFSTRGEIDAAILDSEIARSLFVVFGNDHYAALACNYLGALFRQISQYQISLNWYERALSYYDRLGLKRKQSMVRMNLGVTYYKMARYADADKALTESLNIGIKGKWLHRQCFANIALGNVRRLQRDFDSARRHLHAAYNQAQELTYPREEALALEFLGDVYRDEGQPAEARRFYARAKAIAEKLAPEGDIVMEVHRRVGDGFGPRVEAAG